MSQLPRNRWVQIVVAAAVPLLLLAIAAAAERHGITPDRARDAPWTGHLQRVDEALAKNDVGAAEHAWHAAYVKALGSRRWEGMIDAADAQLRIGTVAGTRKASEAKARGIYLAALFRARQQGSLDGVLRVTGAFATLGDREVVDQCLRIAEHLAAQGTDGQARDRLRAFRERTANRMLIAGSPDF